MKIVQLSDIHVGSQFQESIFNKVLQEINEIRPDTVLITGDLTNEGLKSEYEKCKKLLSKLTCKKIITISGNHDYRNSGYLVFKKYFPFETVNELDKDVVLVTIGTARPDRNEGEVGYRQNLWLERTRQVRRRHLTNAFKPPAAKGGNNPLGRRSVSPLESALPRAEKPPTMTTT